VQLTAARALALAALALAGLASCRGEHPPAAAAAETRGGPPAPLAAPTSHAPAERERGVSSTDAALLVDVETAR
jgi:hypothetical protein